MNNINTYLHDERFWVALAFVVFILVFYKKLTYVIITTLDKRSNDIRLEIESAENTLKEAENNLSLCKERQDKIKIEISQILERANKSAINIAHESKVRLESLLGIKELSMNMKIQQQEDNLKQELLRDLVDEVFAKVSTKLANDNERNPSSNWKGLLDDKLKNFIQN